MNFLSVIGEAATTVRSFLELLKSATDIKRVPKARDQMIKLRGDLEAAVTAQAELANDKRRLEEKVMELEDRERQKQGYRLQEIGPGAFAYVAQPGVDLAEPPHWACQPCLETGKKSILQRKETRPQTMGEGNQAKWACDSCGAFVWVYHRVTPTRALPPRPR